MRVPYERIAPFAISMITKMVLASDSQALHYWHDAYLSLLKASGWDEMSFDKETQKRVDEGWDDTKPVIYN